MVTDLMFRTRFLWIVLLALCAYNVALAQRKTRIACIGNSITYGYLVPHREQNAYPAQLQQLLGKDYEVINFGVSGKTALHQGGSAYIATPQYLAALQSRPDIVLIKLGTNDSRPYYRKYIDSFYDHYKELVERFMELPSHPKVVLVFPVTNFLGKATDEAYNHDIPKYILPVIRRVAAEKKLDTVDLHAVFVDKAELFPDKLHPDSAGAALIAQYLYRFLSSASYRKSSLSVARIFSSNMVLQQGQVNPVWGWAKAGEKISVSFNGKQLSAKADLTGKWKVELPVMSYGGPYKMVVKGAETLTFDNIMIGEVWLCSGQSNMGVQMLSASNPEEEIAAADVPKIRLFSVGMRIAQFPEDDLEAGRWVECSPATVKKFSAVAYHFGHDLYKKLNVPIGLIHCSVGGTYAENWMSPEVLEKDTDFLEPLTKLRSIPPFTQAFKKNEQPTLLFNGMVNPLVPFGIKGVIWYQGEANTGRALQYKRIFPDLITDWRAHWHHNKLPFLFVSLANYTPAPELPVESSWAELREAQASALKLSYTGMALAIDVGEASDLHPKNKKDVGKRLALSALKVAYHQQLVHAGPMFTNMQVSNGTVHLSFSETGSGLYVKDGEEAIRGFAVAGEDHHFYWAKAVLGNDHTVRVQCDEVKQPVAVRYAWADNPGPLNLYNKEGLPAAPFRTDNWERPGKPAAGIK
jgi:sialate O-acetylesterase